MIDIHVHTEYSTDSIQRLEPLIQEAIEKKIKVIAITDHIDYDYPGDDIQFDYDVKKQFEEIERLQEKYYNEIKILKGLELGLQTHVHQKNNQLIDTYDFDFIIGSIHACDNKDLYNKEYYNDKTRHEAWDVYLDSVIEIVEAFDCFSVLGHLDILKRYSEEVREVPLAYIEKKLVKLFNLMIEKEIGLEVNTSGLRENDYGLNQTLPSEDILEIYYKTGGRIITIGTDSHSLETVGSFYEEAKEMLKRIGFDKIYYAEEMKLMTINI